MALLTMAASAFFAASARAASPPLCSDITKIEGSGSIVVGGSDGRAYYSGVYFASGSSWNTAPPSWVALFGGQALFPPCTNFGGASPDGYQVDVFGVGKDGVMYTAYTSNGSNWKWGAMQGGAFPVGARVSAVERSIGHRQIDVFALGTDGHLWTAYWNNGWSGFGTIGTMTFPKTNPVFVLPHSIPTDPSRPAQLDVFIVGSDNNVYTNYFNWYNPGWHAWGSLAPVSLTGSLVSGIGQTYPIPNQKYQTHLDLFGVDQNGQVRTTWWNNGWWNSWTAFNNITVLPGTPISASTYYAVVGVIQDIELYTVDTSGFLRKAIWAEDNGWTAWSKVGSGPAGGIQVSSPINKAMATIGEQVIFYTSGTLTRFNGYTGEWTAMD